MGSGGEGGRRWDVKVWLGGCMPMGHETGELLLRECVQDYMLGLRPLLSIDACSFGSISTSYTSDVLDCRGDTSI